MGLIIPSGPSWAYYSDNLTTTDIYKDLGTNVTAGANDTKGSTVSILSALSHDCEYLRIGIHGFSASGVNSSTLIDIMIDYAGGTSWETDPIIPNLLGGYSAICATDYTANTPGITMWYEFPLWVPAGASLGARAQTAHTSDIETGRVVIQARGGNRNPASWWCGQRVTAIGIDTVNSRGTIMNTETAPSWGAWANVGSTLAADCGAIQFACQGDGDSSQPNNTTRMQIGVSSTQIGPTLVRATSSSETACSIPPGIMFESLPSGTQFQGRCNRSYGSATGYDVAIYAVH